MFKARNLKSNPVLSVGGVLVNYDTGRIATPDEARAKPDTLFVVVARANNTK